MATYPNTTPHRIARRIALRSMVEMTRNNQPRTSAGMVAARNKYNDLLDKAMDVAPECEEQILEELEGDCKTFARQTGRNLADAKATLCIAPKDLFAEVAPEPLPLKVLGTVNIGGVTVQIVDVQTAPASAG